MARWKDVTWALAEADHGNCVNVSTVQTALLMDIRDELKRLNNLLHCTNFQAIPRKLDAIRKNTAKKRRKKAGVKP